MKKILSFSLLLLLNAVPLYAKATPMQNGQISAIKSEILTLAESFKGQGDPDRSKQKQLETLVDRLLIAAPQKPVAERLSLIQGAWHQVWGPYDYRSEGRGIEPPRDCRRLQLKSKT